MLRRPRLALCDPTLPYAILLAPRDRDGYEWVVADSKSASTTTTVEEWRGPVLDVLRSLIADHERSEEVLQIFETLVARNSDLELQLMQVLSRRNKNEGVSSAQLQLLLDRLAPQSQDAAGEAEVAPCSAEVEEANRRLHDASAKCSDEQPQTPEPPPAPSLRNPFPEELERKVDIIPVPEEQRVCPVCGAARQCIGHDTVEVADLVPAEIIIRVEKREKMKCQQCDGELVRAPVGDRIVGGGRFGSRLASQLVVDKYDDGLPLHRQRERLARMGLVVAISTLADQVTWVTDLLTPLWHAAARRVLAAQILHVDGTSLPVLTRDKKTHKKVGTGKKLGTLWGYVGDETALYLYCSSGHKTGQQEGDYGPEDFLANRTGYTVADAAGVFDSSFEREEHIECGCNMHARRYFVKALDGGDDRAALAIAAFKKLYEIEERIRSCDDEERLAVRQQESKPVYDELLHWCEVYKLEERPSSPLGRAINYLLNHQEAFTRFLVDGCVPIDNGEVERLHVRAALTRKNYLFAGSDAGGRRAAIAYTILGSCRLAGVNPEQYLADVLPKLARRVRLDEVERLLPASWRDERAALVQTEPASDSAESSN